MPRSKTCGATSPAERARAATLRGFPPLARADARVLVLGSMPGAASLAAAEYYAHPRNAFWPIVSTLLGVPADAPYRRRVAALTARGVALWDVVAQCARPGSLDASIDPHSIVVNDFAGFFARHPRIAAVFCNGGAAVTLYRRLALPTLAPALRALPLTRLPSTSPAHAARSFGAKLEAWRALVQVLDEG